MICFDTGPLIWGIQGKAREGQEEMVERTQRYIKHLSEKKVEIVLPAPVVGEYLMGFDEADRKKQIQLINEVFRVPSFDMRAAVIAAELQSNLNVIKEIRESTGVGRAQLQIDAQVVAIAIANQAEKIITNDNHFKNLAQGRIEVTEVPSVHTQMDLPFSK